MAKTIKVFKDKKTEDQYFKLKDFADIIDIKLVDKYLMKKVDGNIVILFYDKDGNQIVPFNKDL